MSDTPENMTPCPCCGGEGRETIGRLYVTHDMALDAGDPNMEGMYIGEDWAECAECGGCGVVPTNEQ